MPADLADCPSEIVESIVVLLELRDICSLRQTSRALATKSSQSHFQSFFLSKRVDITEKTLQAFVEVTKPGHLGCLIQHLVLVGVVINTKKLQRDLHEATYSDDELTECYSDVVGSHRFRPSDWATTAQRDLEILQRRQRDHVQLHETGTDLSLLSKAFRNIVANSSVGRLLSLTLEVVVYRDNAEKRFPPQKGGRWRFIWKSAVETFHTTFRSLSASSLPIEKLNIFSGRRLQCCSLAANELGSIDTTDKGLITSLASLKSLSISLSDRIIFHSNLDAERSYDPDGKIDRGRSEERRDITEMNEEAADENNFNGLAKILQLSGQLKNLEVHQYGVPRRRSDGIESIEMHRERLLQRAAEMKIPPQLRRLELRGLLVREQDLLMFIRRTGVLNLSMYNVSMCSGTFKSVFDFCASDAADMERLYFDRLVDGKSNDREISVYFDGPGSSKHSPTKYSYEPGPSSDFLDRRGNEVKQKIIYRSLPRRGRLVGSFANMKWLREQWREYGSH